jgi:hypothetical protein
MSAPPGVRRSLAVRAAFLVSVAIVVGLLAAPASALGWGGSSGKSGSPAKYSGTTAASWLLDLGRLHGESAKSPTKYRPRELIVRYRPPAVRCLEPGSRWYEDTHDHRMRL